MNADFETAEPQAGKPELGPRSDVAAPVGTDPIAILTTLDAVVYNWDIGTDRLAWGPNVGAILVGFEGSALASGAGYASLISNESESSRFQAIQSGLASDDGRGAPFRVTYQVKSVVGALLDVEDFGRWFADGAGRPCRVHGVVRVISRAPVAGPPANVVGEPGFEETLCTRRAFNTWVEARCREARPSDANFAVLMVGLINLAAINRREGYDATDELILAVGRRLAKSLRAGDKLVRYSGGKFAMMIALGPADQLDVATARIARGVNGEPFETSAGLIRAHTRIGAALVPRHGRTAHLLLQRSEEAFEQAELSRTAYALYMPGHALGETRRRERQIADEIVAALNERRVTLAFQPVRPARAGGKPFEEALLRIRRDDGGIIGPDAIVPIAERLGLIEMLDERVLELSLERLLAEPASRLSMNVSIATLVSPDWFDRLKSHLAARPSVAERLTIEIIETQAVRDPDTMAALVTRMKSLGVRIAMDDFGAGHTSFRNLRALGVDMVKIDGAFVQNLARSADDRFFVQALASLARHLRIETVAEWVEDAETMKMLTDWGVDYLQGHFIGRAVIPAPVRVLRAREP